MNCRTNCIINAIIAALFGAALGFIIGAVIACLLGVGVAETADAPLVIPTGGVSAIIAALVGCGLGTIGGIIFAVIGAVIGAVIVAAYAWTVCVAGCDQGPATAVGVSAATGQIGQGLAIDLGDLSCPSAVAARKAAERALAQARAERDAQRNRVDTRRTAMMAARTLRNAALVAIAAVAWWNLPGLVIAVAAAAVATVAALLAEAAYAAALGQLQGEETKVAALEGALALARAAEKAACGEQPPSSGEDPGSPPIEPPDPALVALGLR